MKKVWQKVLKEGEEIRFEFGLGERYIRISSLLWALFFLLLGSLALQGAVFLGIFVFAFALIFVYLRLWFLRRFFVYGFSDQRVLVHRGWLATSLQVVDYNKITDVTVGQTLLERYLFKSGTLTINTAGSDEPEVVLSRIDNPYDIKKKLDRIKE